MTKILCSYCCGTGEVTLSPVYQRTLDVISVDWQTATDIASRIPGVKMSALCNRLVELKHLALVENRPHPQPERGQRFQWRRR